MFKVVYIAASSVVKFFGKHKSVQCNFSVNNAIRIVKGMDHLVLSLDDIFFTVANRKL